MNDSANRRPLIAAALALGIGMGGFVDGIVFHQLLQTHNMLSAKYPTTGLDAATALVNLEINMFWDGVFHTATWLMTAIGILLLWRALQRTDVPRSSRTLLGGMLAGWGLFNLVEGVIDHHLLHLHHVVEQEDHLLWDLAFLASGLLLLLAGWVTLRTGLAPMPQR